MRLVFELRLENTQNLVSINVPEVIESLRASCNGVGMSMTEAAMFVMYELFELCRGQELHAVRERLVIFNVYAAFEFRVRLVTSKQVGESLGRRDA